MSSERLAGKALVEIAGKPSLTRVIERLRMSKMLTEVIVATTVDKEDDVIASLAVRNGLRVHRGSRDDVVGRMQETIDRYAWDAEYVFRALGDQPFLDWNSLDEACKLLVAYPDWDLLLALAFNEEPVYGAGLSPWTRRAWNGIAAHSTSDEREHPGAWLRRNLTQFDYALLDLGHWNYRPYRLELDTPDDLALFKAIYDAWSKDPKNVGEPPLRWVVAYLDRNQGLANVNSHIRERTGTFTTFTRAEIDGWQRDYCNRPIVWGEQLELVGLMQSSGKAYRCESCNGMLVATGIKRGDLHMKCARCRKERVFYSAKPERR
jgi:spore coat polysaccharide biosynthesis protein SpsF